jgi:hypothetical protein
MQRNTLQSWLLLHKDVQVILFGDAAGALEVCWELGIHYEPQPEMTAAGAVRLDYMFARAQELARFNALCYVPCDTLLLADFCEAFNRVEALYPQFAMVGRNWDLSVEEAGGIGEEGWDSRLRRKAECEGRPNAPEQVAYVAFSRGLYQGDVPPLGVDEPGCANWLLWKAIDERVAVVDASEMVLAIHQHPDVILQLWEESGPEEAGAMAKLRRKRLPSVVNAPYLLTEGDIVRNRWYRLRGWRELARRRSREAKRALRGLGFHFGKTRSAETTEAENAQQDAGSRVVR